TPEPARTDRPSLAMPAYRDVCVTDPVGRVEQPAGFRATAGPAFVAGALVDGNLDQLIDNALLALVWTLVIGLRARGIRRGAGFCEGAPFGGVIGHGKLTF